MSKGLIAYQSKYGATKKYVDMLREELDCDVCEAGDCGKAALEKYDWIILAGGIYAGGIAGLNQLIKRYRRPARQRFAVFCVGASPFDEKALAEIKARNLRENFQDVPVFYGRGGWDESKMSWKDRTLCSLLRKAVAKKNDCSLEPWMSALLLSAGKVCDWTDKKYLLPLLEFIRAGS